MIKTESAEAVADQDEVQVEDILDGIHATAYRWDCAKDHIEWAKNAEAVLGANMGELVRGRAFALHIDPKYASARYDAVTGGRRAAANSSHNFSVKYRFLPEGRRGKTALWIEENGVCVTGPSGKAVRAQGTLRVTADRRRTGRDEGESVADVPPVLMNRTEITGRLAKHISGRGHRAQNGAFLLVGIDDLTRINESFGYHIGDEVITIVGQRLAMGIRGGDCLGRFSSNKFGILLSSCEADEVASVVRRMMATVQNDVVSTRAGEIRVHVFAGAVLLPDHAKTVPDAIGRSLQALDMARISPAELFYCYDPDAPQEAERLRNIAVADEVIRALNDRRIMVALQPVVAPDQSEPAFFECLLRLRLPDGTVLDAKDFVPVAQEMGLAKLIDHRALELAVDQLRANPDRKLALNVSAQSVLDRHWLDALEALTGRERSLTERLIIEIKEAVANANEELTAEFVGVLRGMGCKVALDHFGAGYATFRSPRRLGVDMVKIDGSLIENLNADAQDEALVETLVGLASGFGLATVGEWVGDPKSAEVLEKTGVSYLQGNFFGAPELCEDKTPQKELRPAAKPAG